MKAVIKVTLFYVLTIGSVIVLTGIVQLLRND